MNTEDLGGAVSGFILSALLIILAALSFDGFRSFDDCVPDTRTRAGVVARFILAPVWAPVCFLAVGIPEENK